MRVKNTYAQTLILKILCSFDDRERAAIYEKTRSQLVQQGKTAALQQLELCKHFTEELKSNDRAPWEDSFESVCKTLFARQKGLPDDAVLLQKDIWQALRVENIPRSRKLVHTLFDLEASGEAVLYPRDCPPKLLPENTFGYKDEFFLYLYPDRVVNHVKIRHLLLLPENRERKNILQIFLTQLGKEDLIRVAKTKYLYDLPAEDSEKTEDLAKKTKNLGDKDRNTTNMIRIGGVRQEFLVLDRYLAQKIGTAPKKSGASKVFIDYNNGDRKVTEMDVKDLCAGFREVKNRLFWETRLSYLYDLPAQDVTNGPILDCLQILWDCLPGENKSALRHAFPQFAELFDKLGTPGYREDFTDLYEVIDDYRNRRGIALDELAYALNVDMHTYNRYQKVWQLFRLQGRYPDHNNRLSRNRLLFLTVYLEMDLSTAVGFLSLAGIYFSFSPESLDAEVVKFLQGNGKVKKDELLWKLVDMK